MLDQIFGLILLGLGIKKSLPPVVLGDQDTTTQATGSTGASNTEVDDDDDDTREATDGLKIMRPKWSVEQQEAFQKERAKREKNITKISEARVKELRSEYLAKQKERRDKDKAANAMFEVKVKAFKSAERKAKLLALSTKYQTTITARLNDMQKKLEYMSTVLDRVTAAAGALKAQGKDVSQTESLVSSAQAKVTSATSLVAALVSSVSTTLTVSSETNAKDDVMKALETLKTQMEPVRAVFTEAHQAVGAALESVEEFTNATEEATP